MKRIPLLVAFLLAMSFRSAAIAESPKVQRMRKALDFSESVLKKLRYKSDGYTFENELIHAEWNGRTTSGDKVSGEFSFFVDADGLMTTKYYLEGDVSAKTRAAVLQDWVNAGLINAAIAEESGKRWQELSQKAVTLKYAVQRYGGWQRTADDFECAMIWSNESGDRRLRGLFLTGVSNSTRISAADVESRFGQATSTDDRRALMASWVDAGVLSADTAATVMLLWDNGAAKRAAEDRKPLTYGFRVLDGQSPSVTVK